MPASDRSRHLLDLLARLGADGVGHEGGTLLAHLVGTADLLRSWNAREALCEAGLFHSIYGTESFSHALVRASDRALLQRVLGEEAEGIAYTFGAMEKQGFYDNLLRPDGPWWVRDRFTGDQVPIDERQLCDLCTLTVANWLEQRPRADGDAVRPPRGVRADGTVVAADGFGGPAPGVRVLR